MAFGIVKDGTRWPVDIEDDTQWKVTYNHNALIESDRKLVAAVMKAYADLTSPSITIEEAREKLDNARQVAAEILKGHRQMQQEDLEAQYTYVVIKGEGDFRSVLGPFSYDEALEAADDPSQIDRIRK